jgi:VWFA-related protein
VWIFFFDLQHLNPGGFERARTAVEGFIGQRFREGDLAGIVAADKMINNRLTSVRQELLDGLKQLKPSSDSRRRTLQMTVEWPRLLNAEEAIRIARNEREPTQRAIMRACTDDDVQCRFADSAVREKARTIAGEIQRASLATLSSANALASGLARISGPKTVVLITDGFVVQDIETSLRSVVGQAARAGARLYVMDTRGISRGGGPGVEQMQATDEAGAPARFDDVVDGPNSLAVDTGGLMIRNENNLGRALDRIADDASTYYVLAYQPTHVSFDGKYRPLEVKVNRPDVTVRSRRGYLALEPARMLKPQPITSSTAAAPGAERPGSTMAAAAGDPRPSSGGTPSTDPAVGAVIHEKPTPAAGVVRLRPDSQARVAALSSRESTPAGELASRGWEAYQRGDVETALTAFRQAAAQGNVRPWVLYAAGMAHAALGQTTEAIAAWERVRDAAPDFEPIYMDLADTHAQMGNLTHALATLRDAEKRWPKSADVQSAIGVILVRRGALDDGISALNKAAAAKPDDALAHLNLGRAYELRFHRGRRYVASQRRWVASEEDRTKAAESYERCIKLGGPYAQKAAEALSMLQWGKSSGEGRLAP